MKLTPFPSRCFWSWYLYYSTRNHDWDNMLQQSYLSIYKPGIWKMFSEMFSYPEVWPAQENWRRENPRSWSLEKKWPVSCSLVLINSKGDTDANKAALWKQKGSQSAPHCCVGAHEASVNYSSANFKTAINQKKRAAWIQIKLSF